MVRAPGAAAMVVRRADGSLVSRIEHARATTLTRVLRPIPFVRGILTLLETIVLGSRALAFSSAIAVSAEGEGAEGKQGDEPAPDVGALEALALLVGLSVGGTIFFVGPAAATFWLDRWLPSPAVALLEGALRLGLLLAYIWNVSRSPQLRRVFQYHGAEHMAIQAHEEGLPLTAPSVRRLPKEHARCGTAFLLTVVVVSMLVFLPFSSGPVWWRLGSRLLLVPVVAALAYEAIRLGAAHPRLPVVRWLFDANLALQRLTTREPDDEQIRVAIAAVEQCVEAERAARSST